MAISKLTNQIVEKELPVPKSGMTIYREEGREGFGVRVTANGAKAFVLDYSINGDRHIKTIGRFPAWSVGKARAEAYRLRQQVETGINPAKEKKAQRQAANAERQALSVAGVLDVFDKRYIQSEGLRSADHIREIFERLIKPQIGSIKIHDLQRADIIKMLDKIEDDNGIVMADRTLAHLRKALNWYAVRDEKFNSPIVRGMARTKPKERARDRILSDEEIRDVLAAANGMGAPYPAFIRTLLLTGQRRSEVAGMAWAEIENVDGQTVWIIPAERYKTKRQHAVPLIDAMLAQIGERPDSRDTQFIFSTTAGTTCFSGFSKFKQKLDEKIAAIREKEGREPMLHWTLHDLRRTARSLMSRAGINSDIAEQVLGHVLAGVRGTYDRHCYLKEKRDALERLAALIEHIENPPADNVLTIRRRK